MSSRSNCTDRYVLTPEGRAVIDDLELRCPCRREVEGGLIWCPDCGTVYALLSRQNLVGLVAAVKKS